MPLIFKANNPEEPRRDPVPLNQSEEQVANIIQTATGDLETAAMSNAVREAIASRNYEQIVNSFPFTQTEAVLNQTADVYGNVIRDAIGTGFSAGFKGRFDYTDPRSTEWAMKQSAQLVTAVTDETRATIRAVIGQAFTKNLTVRETAKQLQTFIGLNNRQQNSLEKFIIANAQHPNFEKLITQYKAKAIKYRSQMIARTEIITSESQGRFLGWTQAIEAGDSSPKSMKRWSAAGGSERTCDICQSMNGMSVQWDKPFPNGVFDSPAHVMCRCSTSLLEPDSALAQNFMEAPVQVEAPPRVEMPTLPVIAIGNLKAPQEAVDQAFDNPSTVSTFQYDAGQIENLNVSAEQVMFNGSPHTEVRFKLTEGAKTRLTQEAERSDAKDDGKWHKADSYLLVDKKNNGTITFNEIPKDGQDRTALRRTVYDGSKNGAIYVDEDATSKTYTRYMPNGTAIRFVTSKEAYAFDGQVRVMIPGKATAAQVDSVMKELKITASRLPTEEDVTNLKKAKIISLFNPQFGSTLTKAPIEINAEIEAITTKYGFKLKDVTTALDSDGALQVLLPEKATKKLMTETGVKSITHSLGNYFYDIPQEEKDKRVAAFFTDKTKLTSNIQRRVRGIVASGMSESEDIASGGADYVFTRPSQVALSDTDHWNGTIVYDPKTLLRRTDWFAYGGDRYGVKNPKYLRHYSGGRNVDNVNYIEEMTNPSHRAEVMFRDTIDNKDIHAIYVDPQTRDGAISILKGMGIDSWNGRKIEDVILVAKGY